MLMLCLRYLSISGRKGSRGVETQGRLIQGLGIYEEKTDLVGGTLAS
jgi:hypothetical protein